MSNICRRLAVAAALTVGFGVSSQALAGTYFYSGNLGPGTTTFDNPNGDTGGSGVHYYNVTQFTVTVTGAYTFEMASPNTTGTPSNALDTNLRLYANFFNPAAPTGQLAFNDDFTGTLTVLPGPYAGTVGPSGTGFTGAQPASRLLNIALTAGTQYFIVNTSFRNTSFVGTGTTAQASGDYYTGISGPGDIVVPAPGALALLGLAGLAGGRRRRRN